MSGEEALALVMCRYGKVEAAFRKRKAAVKGLENGPNSKQQRFMQPQIEAEVEDCDDGPIEDHLQVEIDWGDDEHSAVIYFVEIYGSRGHFFRAEVPKEKI